MAAQPRHAPRAAAGVLALIAALSIAPCAVAAESPAVQEEEQNIALELFKESEALYNEGDFERAAELLETAYEMYPEPTLLYNLARAREGQGQLIAAADAYERYLEGFPNAPDRGSIERRIRSLRDRDEERRRLEEERRLAQQRLAEMEKNPRRSAPPPPPPKQEDHGEEASVLAGPLPWVLFGVGVTGVAVGLGLGAAAQSKHDQAAEAQVQTEAFDKQQSAKDFATGANVAIVAGSAIAALGGVLGVVGLASRGSNGLAPAQSAWQLRAGPTSIGVDVRF
jgi:tetratricopeptide (TPR) repeat protein